MASAGFSLSDVLGLGPYKRAGKGYLVRCPVHEDKNPSLSVRNGDRGLLFRCHGCEATSLEIVHALRQMVNGDAVTPFRDSYPKTYRQNAIPDLNLKLVRRYIYTDERWSPLFRVNRYTPKAFKAQRFENGKWVGGMGNVEPVLYRLPLVAKSNYAIYCEGEKDAETLQRMGFCATTAPFGSKSCTGPHNLVLANKWIYLVSDNDMAGRSRTEKLKAELGPIARGVAVPELPETKDITEWFDAGFQKEEFIGRLHEAGKIFRKNPLSN